jgi:hypothetical protein
MRQTAFLGMVLTLMSKPALNWSFVYKTKMTDKKTVILYDNSALNL